MPIFTGDSAGEPPCKSLVTQSSFTDGHGGSTDSAPVMSHGQGVILRICSAQSKSDVLWATTVPKLGLCVLVYVWWGETKGNQESDEAEGTQISKGKSTSLMVFSVLHRFAVCPWSSHAGSQGLGFLLCPARAGLDL